MDSTTPAIVDTDVISFLFKSHPLASGYQTILAGRPLAVSRITIAEIEYGMEVKNRGANRRDLMRRFLDRFTPLLPDAETAVSGRGSKAAARRRAGRSSHWSMSLCSKPSLHALGTQSFIRCPRALCEWGARNLIFLKTSSIFPALLPPAATALAVSSQAGPPKIAIYSLTGNASSPGSKIFSSCRTGLLRVF